MRVRPMTAAIITVTARGACDHVAGFTFDQEGWGGTCTSCGEYLTTDQLIRLRNERMADAQARTEQIRRTAQVQMGLDRSADPFAQAHNAPPKGDKPIR